MRTLWVNLTPPVHSIELLQSKEKIRNIILGLDAINRGTRFPALREVLGRFWKLGVKSELQSFIFLQLHVHFSSGVKMFFKNHTESHFHKAWPIPLFANDFFLVVVLGFERGLGLFGASTYFSVLVLVPFIW